MGKEERGMGKDVEGREETWVKGERNQKENEEEAETGEKEVDEEGVMHGKNKIRGKKRARS